MLPLALRMEHKLIVVVGGGVVAARRVRTLLDVGATVRVVAPDLDSILLQLRESGVISVEQRVFRFEDLEGAWLVFALTSSDSLNREIAALCASRQLWCLRGGAASESDVWMMAYTKREGVTMAVSAGGRPRLAARLKQRLSRWLQEQDLTGK